MPIHNNCFYFQNRLIQTSQTGGQQYSDTSPFSIPWSELSKDQSETAKTSETPEVGAVEDTVEPE